MPHLQKAKITNAQKWLTLVAQDRANLEYWMPYLQELQTLEQAQQYIQKNANLDFYLGEHIFEIWKASSLVGLVTLHNGRIRDKSVDLGYWLGVDYTGKGIMAEACQHLISKTFVDHPIQMIYIRCLEENLPSRALAVRLGFELKYQEGAIFHFQMSRAQWMQEHYEEEDLFYFLEILDLGIVI
jgi:ribosomal-protein-serine acetyltransferase